MDDESSHTTHSQHSESDMLDSVSLLDSLVDVFVSARNSDPTLSSFKPDNLTCSESLESIKSRGEETIRDLLQNYLKELEQRREETRNGTADQKDGSASFRLTDDQREAEFKEVQALCERIVKFGSLLSERLPEPTDTGAGSSDDGDGRQFGELPDCSPLHSGVQNLKRLINVYDRLARGLERISRATSSFSTPSEHPTLRLIEELSQCSENLQDT
ncbi:unnamed protein product [Calicophoron daubneyi]|uniref:Uncharacterized protein n=1 Tax=Calicophoron daubneyi TaxID=300641 RepID=A0AAV2TBG8_CALDB